MPGIIEPLGIIDPLGIGMPPMPHWLIQPCIFSISGP